jgi:hypothetical protein
MQAAKLFDVKDKVCSRLFRVSRPLTLPACLLTGGPRDRWWKGYRRDDRRGIRLQRRQGKFLVGIGRKQILTTTPPAFQVYIASRDIKACEATAQRLNKQGPGKCYALAADLSKYEDIVKLIAELGKREESKYSHLTAQVSRLIACSRSPERPRQQLWCQLGSTAG